MRNKIFGGIGVVWGAFILSGPLLGKQVQAANEAAQVGQNAAYVTGALLLILGLFYFFKKPKATS